MVKSIRLDPAALASFESAAVRFDANGTCTYANDAAYRLLGGGSRTGWSVHDVFPEPEENQRALEELGKRLRGEASSYTAQFTRPVDGVKIPISVYAFPVLDDKGNVAGSMAIVADLRLAIARRAMHQAIETQRSSADLLAAVAEAMRPLVQFDEFYVSALSRARKHLRRVFSTDPQSAQNYRFKWWPLPEFVQKTLESENARIIDIRALFEQPEYAELARREDAAKTYKESGITHSISIPITSGKRIIAFVGINTRSGKSYSEEDLALCLRLPLGEAVKMALHHEEESTLRACVNLVRDMGATRAGVQQVAQVLVDSLAAHFGWEHVAVFQYDEDREAFLVLAQASGAGRSVDAGSFAPGLQGIVARAYREQAVINVPDVGPGAPGSEGFIQGVCGIASELAMPIPGDRRRWVLNVESAFEGAFADEEIELLEPLLTEAGNILDRLSLLEMSSAILHGVNDAVIETNRKGLIRCINPAGCKLLGAADPSEFQGQPLGDFIVDPLLAASLMASDRFSRREIELRTRDGEVLPALLSGANLPEGIGGRVFVASDLTYQREVERHDELKEVFRHASLECRVPLALASGWLAELAQNRPELAAPIERVLQQIRKADMPLERLLRYAAGPGAEPEPYRIDIKNLVADVLAQLPESDTTHIHRLLPEDEVYARGIGDDLRFCLETSLSFALRSKPQNKDVEVELTVEDGRVRLSVGGDWTPSLGTEPAAGVRQRWRRTVASDLALAETVIEDLMDRQHGSFSTVMDGGLRLSLDLPQAAGDPR